jgi:hypothetical protein
MTSSAQGATPEPPLARVYAAIFAAVGWAVLALQFVLVMRLAPDNNLTRPQAAVNFFSYFTVIINLVVAVAFTCRLLPPDSRAYRTATDPRIATAIATYITIVGAVYSLLLRAVWNPTGLQLVADVALHDVLPVVYVLFWVIFVRHDATAPWSDAARWLTVPLAYVSCALVRGAATGWYPYYFLDVGALGPGSVARVIVALAVAFWVVGLGFVALTRWLARRRRS